MLEENHNTPGRLGLTTEGIYKLMLYQTVRAGIRTRPHGLGHAVITEALELTGGNLAAVRDFS